MNISDKMRSRINVAIENMRQLGDRFDKGLSSDEFEQIEARFGFKFPPDIRYFLETALPVDTIYPNWRVCDRVLIERIDWPRRGIESDVLDGTYWDPAWGDRPKDLTDAVNVAMKIFESAPKLIPISNTNFVPATPNLEGNPVFVVNHTDVIFFGRDLAHRLMYVPDEGESQDDQYPPYAEEYRYITFWTDMVRHKCNLLTRRES